MMNFKLDFGCSCRQAFCLDECVCVGFNDSDPDLLDADPQYNLKVKSGNLSTSLLIILELLSHTIKNIQKQGNTFFCDLRDSNPWLCE